MPTNLRQAVFHFHVSRAARDKYQFDDSLFSLRGNVVFVNFFAARAFAQKLNQARDFTQFPDGAVQAGQLNALGLLHEIFHYILGRFRMQRGAQVMQRALVTVYGRLGAPAVNAVLTKFVEEFPPVPVYRGQVDIETYLRGSTEGIPNREIVLEELLLVRLTNENPAAAPLKELFDDSSLVRQTAYLHVIENLSDFFAGEGPFGPDNQSLIEALRAPIRAAPGSLAAQLEFVLARWGDWLGGDLRARFMIRALAGLDLIREEQRGFFPGADFVNVGFGAGPIAEVPIYRRYDERGVELPPEPEKFSPDLEWMSDLVLVAKSTFVWLDQLSKQYGRAIKTLDQIPDEELDRLAHLGFTGLWLIGVWERSKASRIIKQRMGNADADASAYSLYDYEIASELGGGMALENLKERAWRRGIRLASDMVPNHMGIDSRWVIEHPDWFMSLDNPPYPVYSFNGPDLSSDGRVMIQIEDHYWDRSDAAVVFKRTDRATGSVRYIYHGNDGTSFPWNDTAQLNYLDPKVREAIIQTILHVARQFPVIRFDAAMTLAKRHLARLWYPIPGKSEDSVPSRSEYALTKEEFDALMPEEFWREVVDRVAAEAPGTLLLAEAFWLMEGYFVRTLGMHRVYNSAFMVMLRDEANAKYRTVIKNTIEFDPEILRRYVNFMNNPDERTAIDQFGSGDKYFGVATLMATLPGLPMFGHGQVEGFTERYGMEFRRGMLDETPNSALVERHRGEISPLLHRRELFASVENFLLYDFRTPGGRVDENVFAFSNRSGKEKSIVIYNNAYASTRGRFEKSVAFRDKARDELVTRTLAEGLGIGENKDAYTIFRETVSGLEYIRRNEEIREKGLRFELAGYEHHVFLDFREVVDDESKRYALVTDYLGGRGTASIEGALRDIYLQPVQDAFRGLVNVELIRQLTDLTNLPPAELKKTAPPLLEKVEQNTDRLAREIKVFLVGNTAKGVTPTEYARTQRSRVEGMLRLATIQGLSPGKRRNAQDAALSDVNVRLKSDVTNWYGLLAWLFVHRLGELAIGSDKMDGHDVGLHSRAWLDEWQLTGIIRDTLNALGSGDARVGQLVELIRIATTNQKWDEVSGDKASTVAVEITRADAKDSRKQLLKPSRAYPVLLGLLEDAEVRRFLNVNRFNDIVWFNQEAFNQMLSWLPLVGAARAASDASRTEKEIAGDILEQHQVVEALSRAEVGSEYRLENLLNALRQPSAVQAVALAAVPTIAFVKRHRTREKGKTKRISKRQATGRKGSARKPSISARPKPRVLVKGSKVPRKMKTAPKSGTVAKVKTTPSKKKATASVKKSKPAPKGMKGAMKKKKVGR